MKIVKKIKLKIVIFYSREKSLYIAWASFLNECRPRSESVLFAHMSTSFLGIFYCKVILVESSNIFCV